MIQFKDLSFWEKNRLTENIDYLVVGGGIVGCACALQLRELNPKAKIVLLERGYLSTGASTKNAGFACFGSLTEIADDLEHMNETQVWDTVNMRYEGLKRLEERFPENSIGMVKRGSWDLIHSSETELEKFKAFIPHFNANIKAITGQENCFSFDQSIQKETGFQGIVGGFKNRLEGEIDTGSLLMATNKLLALNDIMCLYGVHVKEMDSHSNDVVIHTNFGELKATKVAVTVNGFAKQLFPELDVQPARAQVLVTEKMANFELPGTFHFDKGYYYFRSVQNRLLIGGGRNINFQGETTSDLITTEEIKKGIQHLIHTVVLPNKPIKIEYEWAGIMGVGNVKQPIVELHKPNIGLGVRMGGMGVAIGSIVGEKLAKLLHNS